MNNEKIFANPTGINVGNAVNPCNPTKSGQGGGGISHGTKLISILVVCLLVSVALVGSASAWSGGGTEANPYILTSASDLQDMNNYLSAYYKLGSDIDCSGVSSWTPIGSSSSAFFGHLNGNGKTIKNLTFTTSTNKSGIFSIMGSEASITNCTFDAISHTSTKPYVGIICGDITSTSTAVTMTNVTLQNSKLSSSSYFAGGFVSHTSSSGLTCTNCVCKNTTISTGNSYVGCFVGCVDSNSTFTCNGCTVNSCKVESTGSQDVGGFVGEAHNSSLELDGSCVCKNSIINATGIYVGGFMGYVYSSSVSVSSGATLENCYISGDKYVGGFVGYDYSSSPSLSGVKVLGCTVKGTNYVGGVVAHDGRFSNVSSPVVKNCTITATSGTASGVVGEWS